MDAYTKPQLDASTHFGRCTTCIQYKGCREHIIGKIRSSLRPCVVQASAHRANNDATFHPAHSGGFFYILVGMLVTEVFNGHFIRPLALHTKAVLVI